MLDDPRNSPEARKEIERRIKERRKELGMAEPERKPIYPVETVVRIIKTGKMALIKKATYLNDRDFLYYQVQIEGEGEKLFLAYRDEVDLECLPDGSNVN